MKKIWRLAPVLILIALASIATHVEVGETQILPNNITATAPSGVIVACPQGDGDTFAEGGCVIEVIAIHRNGTPFVGIPASDIWIIGCTDQFTFCGIAQNAIDADAPTDAQGRTTISGTPAIGNWGNGVAVVVQGELATDGASGIPDDICIETVVVRNPDFNGDLEVDSQDFTFFGDHWPPLGGTYHEAADFNNDGVINSADFTEFGNHYLHSCQ